MLWVTLGLGWMVFLFGCASPKTSNTLIVPGSGGSDTLTVPVSSLVTNGTAQAAKANAKQIKALKSLPELGAGVKQKKNTDSTIRKSDATKTAKVTKASEDAPRNTDPLIMENADKMEGFRSRGEYILTGHVRFRHGALHFETERAVWSKELNQVSCEQGMRITHHASELTADRGTYSKARNEAEAEGNVQMHDSTGDLRGKGSRLTYHRLTHDVVFFGAPELRRLYRDSTGGVAKDSAKGRDRDSAKTIITHTLPVTDTLVLRAFRMTYNDSTLVAVAESSVVITRKKTLITCKRAEYRDKVDSLFLTGDPKVVVDRSQVQGDKMRMRLYNEEIRGLLVQGKAKALSIDPKTDSTPEKQSEVKGDSLVLAFTGKDMDSAQVFRGADGMYFDTPRPLLRNHMSGDRMVMRFQKREVRNAQVVGGAHSTYYHLENGRLKGRNVAKGDTIRFAFADGQIDEVLVSGNAHGTYFGRAQVAKRDSLAPAQDSLKQKGKTQ